MYKYYNPNRVSENTGDCVIRAITKATNQSWDKVYWDLCDIGFIMGDWGNSNKVWNSYLMDCGFIRKVIPNTCPDCYTVKDFCKDNPGGIFILATGSHVVAIVNGNYFDTWDSGNEVPIYYYERRVQYGIHE